jgi:hypothetical protein
VLVGDDNADDLREWLSCPPNLSDSETGVWERMPNLARRLADTSWARTAIADLRQAIQQAGARLHLRGGSHSNAACEQSERSNDGYEGARAVPPQSHQCCSSPRSGSAQQPVRPVEGGLVEGSGWRPSAGCWWSVVSRIANSRRREHAVRQRGRAIANQPLLAETGRRGPPLLSKRCRPEPVASPTFTTWPQTATPKPRNGSRSGERLSGFWMDVSWTSRFSSLKHGVSPTYLRAGAVAAMTSWRAGLS